MTEQAKTYKNESDRLKDLRRRKRADKILAFKMWCHKWFWRTLHFTMLARPYSIIMCKLGLYRRYDGYRCMWCGYKHKGLLK